MSKSDQNKVINQTNQNLDWIKQQSAGNRAILGDVYNRSVAAQSEMYPSLTAGYGSIAADTGGMDPSITGDITGAYRRLSTGGYTPEEVGAFKREATRGAVSSYQGGIGRANRIAAATGASGTGAISRMSRESGDAAARAVTGVNAAIAGQKAENMATGARGLLGYEQARVGNRLAGLEGASKLYGMNQDSMTQAVHGILQNYQATGQLSNQDLQILQEVSKRPGLFDNIIRGIGAGAGVVSAAMGVPGMGGGGGATRATTSRGYNPFGRS